jgi:hypothetical protein
MASTPSALWLVLAPTVREAILDSRQWPGSMSRGEACLEQSRLGGGGFGPDAGAGSTGQGINDVDGKTVLGIGFVVKRTGRGPVSSFRVSARTGVQDPKQT